MKIIGSIFFLMTPSFLHAEESDWYALGREGDCVLMRELADAKKSIPRANEPDELKAKLVQAGHADVILARLEAQGRDGERIEGYRLESKSAELALLLVHRGSCDEIVGPPK